LSDDPLQTQYFGDNFDFLYLYLIVIIYKISIEQALLRLTNAIHKFWKLHLTAMQVKSQKAEIFQVGKRNITNQKMIDKWGNAKIALPHNF